MRGIVYNGERAEVVKELEVRAPGPREVIVRMAAAGVCHTGHPTWCRQSMGNAAQPFTLDGNPAWNFAATSSFAERTVVREIQAVPISPDVPLTSACLIACGVITGVGAVLNRA